MNRPLARRAGPFLAASAGLLISVAAGTARAQNVAAPPPVQWPTPPLPDGPISLQSAEVRDFRVVVLDKTLQQPWSLAFLPDGRMLVTQGLMDVVLHPRFAENRFIYISYHKPVPTGRTLGNGQPELAGESTLASQDPADLAGKWEEIRREPLLRELKQPIRDVRQGPDGLLYVLTSENPGAVLRLEPVEATTTR